jgi:hypothetical protein
MVKNIRPLVEKIDSAAWLNAVRNVAGDEYTTRIPEATQANLRSTIDNIWNWIPGRNKVEEAFVDQLAMVMFRNTLWTNPLREFKIGTLEEGETIEEIQLGLLTAVDYDSDRDELEKEIFGQHDIEVRSAFHKRNRQDRYVFTINVPGLRTALLGGQLGSFVTSAMQVPQTSDQYDEYKLMTRILREFDRNGAYFNINVPDVGDKTSGAEESKFLLRRLREMKNTLPFISRIYNPAGMPIATTPDELVLITTAKSEAAMDVEALAAAFNMDKASMEARRIVLPSEDIGIDGAQAILTSNKFFVVADNLIQTTSQFNPAKMTTNHWLHHWQTISASPFAPLILFNSLREDTIVINDQRVITDIGGFTFTDRAGTVEATALERGVLYDIRVEGVTSPVGGVAALQLTLTGQTSPFTRISNNGSIYVGPDEAAEVLTITATAVEGGYTESTTRAVKGDQIVWDGPGVIVQEDSDSDALEEVVPVEPDFTDNVITIPTVNGVQYKDGATNLNNGAVITVVNGTPKTITAVARAGKELATGATASWVFTYVAP